MDDAFGGGTATLRPSSRHAGTGARLVRVVHADEAPLMQLAVRSVLTAAPAFSLAASASGMAEAEQCVLRVAPDLLITDIDLAGDSGLDLCRWTRSVSPQTAVVFLAGRDEPMLIQSAMRAGACGYLLKGSSPDSLVSYLQQAVTGLRVLDERLGSSRMSSQSRVPSWGAGLSPREREVLDEVLAGFGNKVIAQRLCISEDTVKSHVKAIFRKLGARDRAHAVALALGTARATDPAPGHRGPAVRPHPALPAQRRGDA
jgi:DNA-binding NarL/FixJ family response regulator